MDLLEKIRKIEALLARAENDGERRAAQLAKERMEKKYNDRPVEYTMTVNAPWKKKLLVAICSKYGVKAYRYRRQKHTTTVARISKMLMEEVIWPEFKKYDSMFNELAEEILQNLISKIYIVNEEEEILITSDLSYDESVTK